MAARDVNFKDIVLNIEKDEVNLEEIRTDVNIEDSDNLYIKFKFHYDSINSTLSLIGDKRFF